MMKTEQNHMDSKLSAAETAADEARVAKEHAVLSTKEVERTLEETKTELSEAKAVTLKVQQLATGAEAQAAEARQAESVAKAEAKRLEEAHAEQVTSMEEQHVTELREQKEKQDAELQQARESLGNEIKALQGSLHAVKVTAKPADGADYDVQEDSGRAAEEEQAAWDRQKAMLEQQIKAEQSKGQEWHFVAVTYKSQVKSAQSKMKATEEKLEVTRSLHLQELAAMNDKRNAVQEELNSKLQELQQAEQHVSTQSAEIERLSTKLSSTLDEVLAEKKEKKSIAEDMLAFKNQAFMEKTMRDDLEQSLGGVDVFQRAIRCNELEMEIARLGRLNWILDYQLRSATHGMVIDVTTFEPRALLAGWLKRKGTLTWSNKYFRTNYNPDTNTGVLTQHEDEKKSKAQETWKFSQFENILFDIEERYISLFLHGIDDPIRLYAVEEDAFYSWSNYLYFRVFPPNFDL